MRKKISLDQLEQWLRKFGGQEENMRVLTLRAFLYIAHHGEATVADIERDMEVVQSVAHRSIQRLYMGSDSAQVGVGLRLLERFPDPKETRRHIYRLSAKGRQILEEFGA